MDKVPMDAPYRPAFVKYLMDYHRSHTNSLKLACIVAHGSDPGFAVPLAAYFDHIHLHLTGNTKEAKSVLSKHFVENWQQARFTFSSGELEDVQEHFASRSVDLVLFDTCAQYAVPSLLTATAEQLLTPNGCAIFTRYNFSGFPRLERIDDIYEQNAQPRLHDYHDLIGKITTKLIDRDEWTLRVLEQQPDGLDYIDVRPETFYENVTKRVGINAPAVGWNDFESGLADSGSHVYNRRDQERLLEVNEGSICQDFSVPVDRQWLRSLCRQKLGGEFDDDVEECLTSVLSHPYYGTDRLKATYSAVIVLATRNMKDEWNAGAA